MLNQTITYGFLKALALLRYGTLTVVLPNGKSHVFSGSEPGAVATLRLYSWDVIPNMARKGDIGLAEDYRKGLWDADDLYAFMMVGLKNEAALEQYIYGNFLSRALVKLSYVFRRNTMQGSKKNIEAHYDLGNAFYSLWLDPSMTYSAALFDGHDQSLEQAQHNKYDRLVDRMLPSGDVLEIGCGWGGFAERAVARGDYRIKGLTLSHEQKHYADTRLKDKPVQIALQDYRHEKQQYDNIVSIEMFEAVGEEYWGDYFKKLGEGLRRQGRALVQTILIQEKYFESYRKGGDFIRTYIFPGGMLPSAERFAAEAQKVGLRIADQFHFGTHYAQTLRRWLANFDTKIAEVRALGFDDAFIRLWRLYLAACAASFDVGRTDVMQVELRHAT
ncbi:MAG: cyclopropane-fatty-acyl-phospholipid synthase family protein [Alphaproteobacteria bacterium]|nr:cyclopropane-fatty-acyl-phospholipid synthase family protein [Alphaproteobacteria bacterium]